MKLPARTWIVIAIILTLAAGGLLWWLTGGDSVEPAPEPTVTVPTQVTESPTETEPTEPPRDLEPEEAMTETREFEAGASVRVTGFEAVTSQAAGPGEVSGPAIRVSVELTAGEEPIDLAGVLVNAYYGADLTPADLVARPGGQPFEGTIAAREATEGVYVFNVPVAERGDVTIEFIHPADTEPLTWRGSVN